jgi:hypothetical protein
LKDKRQGSVYDSSLYEISGIEAKPLLYRNHNPGETGEGKDLKLSLVGKAVCCVGRPWKEDRHLISAQEKVCTGVWARTKRNCRRGDSAYVYYVTVTVMKP